MRLARWATLLVLASLTVSLVIGVGDPATGAAEKAVLVLVIAGCFLLAVKVSRLGGRIEQRLRRH
ncbi:hypothetical protein GCM10009798_35380 [Nocardioides panacihumi]|uniref:DUF1328 domain-containing protein n=1 Tax=Nocardioides panacihumi TaxID=400774 RepID=A0ABN2RM51_9ACTN